MIAPVVAQGAVFPPASFHAVSPRLLASAMKSSRHSASPSIPSWSSWARIALLASALAAPVSWPVGVPSGPEFHPRRAGRETERVERRLVDARALEAAAGDPERVVRRRGSQLGEREDRRIVELAQYFHPPQPSSRSSGRPRVRSPWPPRHRQCPGALCDQIKADHLSPAVVALAHAVQVPVDQARQDPAAPQVDDLGAPA